MMLARSLVRPFLVAALALTVAGPAVPAQAGPPPAHQPAAPTARVTTPLKVVTANIDFGNGPKRERAQVSSVLKKQPDVVLLQETRDLDLRKPGGKVAGLDQYAVVQKRGVKSGNLRASSILFRTSRFGTTPVRSGFQVGYSNVPGVTQPRTRLLPWAVLRDTTTGQQVAVISVHMPKLAQKNPDYARAYRQMMRSYQGLVAGFRQQQLPVVTGGDWNMQLEARRGEPAYGPVRGNKAAGLRLNWSYGRPCTETHGGRSRIDGLAWRGPVTRLVAQRCLDRLHSDHRPVLVRLRLTGGTRT